MVERTRLFRGATELEYSKAVVKRTADQVVDKGNIVIEANADIESGKIIDFKKADGSTTFFCGRVTDKNEEDMWEIEILSNGWELMNIRIEQVFLNSSPEAIVAAVIGTTSNLTFASTDVSGFTVTKYIAKAYAMDVIKDMMDTLQWQLRIDETDQVFFEPPGNVDNGFVFTNGVTGQINKWEDDNSTTFNRVRIVGAIIDYLTNETASGDGGTEVFVLGNKPSGTVKVTVDGAEVVQVGPNDPYIVDSDAPSITFNTAPPAGASNIIFDYSFNLPVVVDDQNDQSITDLGMEIFKEIPAPWLNDFNDARQYARISLKISIPRSVSASRSSMTGRT